MAGRFQLTYRPSNRLLSNNEYLILVSILVDKNIVIALGVLIIWYLLQDTFPGAL